MSIPFHYILLHPTLVLVGCIPISIYCIIPWCPMTYQHILLIKNTPNDGQKIGVSPPLLDGFIIHIFHYFSYQLAISWVYTAMFYSLEGGLGPWRKAMAFHGHKWWRIFCGNLQDGLCSHHETVRYIYNRPSLSVGCFSQLSYLL